VIAEFDRLDAPATTPSEDVLFDPTTSKQRALILVLGTYEAEELSPGEAGRLIRKLRDLYRNHPDPGIHGAAEWTLRQWKQQEPLQALDRELPRFPNRGQRRWYANSQGQTFAVIEGPIEFRMGSPETDLEQVAGSEPLRRVSIPRRYAIATKEVTVDQFQRFAATNDEYKADEDVKTFLKRYSPDPDGPWIGASWYAAAAYCNWLSQEEGLHRDQWCYLPNKAEKYGEGMTIPANVLERKGYRLPTEAEWEYACRAGTVTSRYYGGAVELLGNYAWYLANSRERAWSCGRLFPNDLGLFDILGNMYEWSQDARNAARPEQQGIVRDRIVAAEVIVDKRPRVFRGGTFMVQPLEVRSAHSNAEQPFYAGIYNGFRLARTCDQ
jgi:formylglycine-generating enzyme required for sulfatase activity